MFFYSLPKFFKGERLLFLMTSIAYCQSLRAVYPIIFKPCAFVRGIGTDNSKRLLTIWKSSSSVGFRPVLLDV